MLRKLWKQSLSSSVGCRLLAPRLTLELLEGRLAPAVHTWTGAAGNLWSDDANWNGGSPAGDPDARLIFPHVLANRATRNDLDGLTVRSLTFYYSTGYSIGGNPITLTAGAEINAQGIPDYPTSNSISCAFVLEANLRIIAMGRLSFSGVISGDHAVSVAGRHYVHLSGANTYSGGTTVGGSVSVGNASALGTGEITLNSGTMSASSRELSNSFRVRGAVRIFESTMTGPGILEEGSTLRIVSSDVALVGGLTGAGTISVERFNEWYEPGTLWIGGDYNQLGRLDIQDGAVFLDGGTLAASVNIAAASSLAGSGFIVGNVVNAGLLDVGGPAAAGQLVIVGDYVQTATGTLRLELGDFDGGNYDRLDVTGTATLDGTLSVALLDDFFAREGDAYAVLTWGEREGYFAAGELPDLGGAFDLDPRFEDGGLALWVIARR